ncbi:hypothetical protein STIAU_4087, partial [Stigmatella aurantiaca DW4/3-1]
MRGVGQGDELDVISQRGGTGLVGHAQRKWDNVVLGAVQEHLADTQRDQRHRGAQLVGLGELGGRAPEECLDDAVPQAQFLGTHKVRYRRERDDAAHLERRGAVVRLSGAEAMARGEPQDEVASRRVSEHDHPVQVQRPGVREGPQVVGAPRDILQGSGPAASGVAHAPVLQVPGREAPPREIRAQVPRVLQVVPGAPEASVHHQHDGMGANTRGQAQLAEVVFSVAIGQPGVRGRRRRVEHPERIHVRVLEAGGGEEELEPVIALPEPIGERADEGPEQHVGQLLVGEHQLVQQIPLDDPHRALRVGNGVGRSRVVRDNGHFPKILAFFQDAERFLANSRHILGDAHLAPGDDEHLLAGFPLAEQEGAPGIGAGTGDGGHLGKLALGQALEERNL